MTGHIHCIKRGDSKALVVMLSIVSVSNCFNHVNCYPWNASMRV
jgi:hypothetical protein